MDSRETLLSEMVETFKLFTGLLFRAHCQWDEIRMTIYTNRKTGGGDELEWLVQEMDKAIPYSGKLSRQKTFANW